MAEIVPGYVTENIVSVVPASESDINAAITAKAADSWILVSISLSGSDVILLFTRTIPSS